MGVDRFDTEGCAVTMKAVVTTGNGGYDKLVYRDVPVPVLGPGEVLVRVLAAGVNNTEINIRLGWYSSSVITSTAEAAQTTQSGAVSKADGGWNEATPFPFIQGTDCCGRVVAGGGNADEAHLGQRILIRACMRPHSFSSMENTWMASDFDGAFAEYVKVPVGEVFPVDCAWSDAELATIPCSYATAENMLHRASLAAGERVLVTGASGGVGSAAVQLAKRRGAHVVGIAARSKMEAMLPVGCDRLIARGDDLIAALGEDSINLVVDNVAGDGFARCSKSLSGAVAMCHRAPLVALL